MPRFTLSPCLEVSPEEATIIFECIKENSQSDEDWAQVAADCNVLATAEFVTWDEDEAWEDYGIALHWNEYWQRARGWAEAQLSESEYLKRHDDEQKCAAERRLKNYFFRVYGRTCRLTLRIGSSAPIGLGTQLKECQCRKSP